jgi:flagellar motor switch/type III secretory pathway protein FliN
MTVGSGELWRIALMSPVFLPASAALARSRAVVTAAAAITDSVALAALEDLCKDADTLVSSSSPPPVQWNGVEIETPFGSLVCVGIFAPIVYSATSNLRPTSWEQTTSVVQGTQRKVQLPLVAAGRERRLSLVSGDTVGLAELVFSIPDIDVRVKVFMEDGLMVERDDAEKREPVEGAIPVRLDLGSLELTLEEIAALRAGHRLELDSQLPAACFLRIGSTVIAQGELESVAEGLVVRVKKILELDATSESLCAM